CIPHGYREVRANSMPKRRELGDHQTERMAAASTRRDSVAAPAEELAASSEAMLPTVRDILHLPVLADAMTEVLAGGERLDTPVRWVHVNETLDAAKLLNGGELLLTT